MVDSANLGDFPVGRRDNIAGSVRDAAMGIAKKSDDQRQYYQRHDGQLGPGTRGGEKQEGGQQRGPFP